jgi:glycosyltransferase involved in cell wall biosynthesis
MQITVILCTYNRCQSLAKALESVAASQLPDSIEWELLVIDNNSKDQTRDVVEDFCRKHPDRFRYVFEREQGKSNALNTGIREARGSILAFMDDDVIVDPAWLWSVTKPLDSDEWAGAGGRILTQQTFVVPQWLALEGPYSMSGMLALFDLGDRGEELKSPPFGTNMAFRKSVFTKYGGFRTDMGPCPGSEIRNEDTEFGRRVMAAGERLWYEPSAIVYHAVPEKRLKKRYFLRFWYDHGRASVREDWSGKSGSLSQALSEYRRILSGFPRPKATAKGLLAKDPKKRFYHRCLASMKMGQIVEMPRCWFSGTRQNQSIRANQPETGHSTTKLGSVE